MITNLYSESFEKPWNEYDYEDPRSFEVFPRADNENEELKRIRFEAAWAVLAAKNWRGVMRNAN